MKPNQTQVEHSLTSKLSQIKSLISGAINDLLKAAEIVVELIDSDQSNTLDIAKGTGVPRSFVENLERVGRHKLHPDLFFAETPGKIQLKQMAIRHGFPYALQERCILEPISVLVMDGKNTQELEMSIDAMTKEQALQVIDKKRIRPTPEQRAWVEGYKLKKAETPAIAPYKVSGKRLIVSESCTIEAGELLRIISQIVGNKLNP